MPPSGEGARQGRRANRPEGQQQFLRRRPEVHVIDFGRAESDVVDDCAASSPGEAPLSPMAYLEDALRRLKNKLLGGPSDISCQEIASGGTHTYVCLCISINMCVKAREKEVVHMYTEL